MSSTTVSDSPRTTGPRRGEISGRVRPERGQPVDPGKAAQLRARLRAAHSSVGRHLTTSGAREPSGRSDRWSQGHGTHGGGAVGSNGATAVVSDSGAVLVHGREPQGREMTAVSHDEERPRLGSRPGPGASIPVALRSGGPGDAPATTPPSIDISRELATVVVTLEGLLDDDSSPALVRLLWDLVVGQGNLSVTVDARRLSLSDPALIWVFRVPEREAAFRGGTLAVVEPSPASASAERSRAAAALDCRRARRGAAFGMAAHPAGSARTTQTKERGAPA